MTENDAKNAIIRYWQIITVIGVFLVGWGSLNSEVGALQAAFAEEKKASKEQTDKQNDVEKTIVRIETKQEQIRKDVDDIKEEQKAQSEKLDQILRKLNESG